LLLLPAAGREKEGDAEPDPEIMRARVWANRPVASTHLILDRSASMST
jgi:hypothetical protein